MADQSSTAAKKSKKKFKLPSFRDLVKPTKSINASSSQSISNQGPSSSASGAHDSFLGNVTESSQPIASSKYIASLVVLLITTKTLGAKAPSHQHQAHPPDSTAPLQSARPALSNIQDLPVRQEGNHEITFNLTSTGDQVSSNIQLEASDSQAPVKEGLKVAGHFLQTLLKKAPEYADASPVKIALSIIRTIIDIKDAVRDNKDRFAQGLKETETILESLKRIEAFGVAEIVKQDVEKFKQEISKEEKNIEELAKKLLIAQILDYEEYKKRIQQIFQHIKVATTSFQLAMAINIQIKASQIHDDVKKAALQRLNPSTKANHKTFLEHQTLKREECTVGTRVRILEQITDWANDHSSDSPRVFWLTGQAGSGKTTIAYTIAKQFETQDNDNKHIILGANFFCSRQFSETQSQTRIVPTIAYQLAHRCRPYADALHVADKFDAVDHEVSTQVKGLLVEPWQQSEATHHFELPVYVIIVDALDEIEGEGGSAFLRNLLLAINEYNLRGLKFLVTSRSDPELVKLCKAFMSRAICRLQDVPIEEAKSDIDTYLEEKLPKLTGSPHLAKVGQQAGGLFIYAATVVRFLTADSSVSAAEQTSMLKDLLSKSDDASDATFLIDILYRQVMHDAFSKLNGKRLTHRLHILYTFLCTAERTSTSIVAALVADGDNEAAEAVLDNLHAVLYIQNDRVFWYHASFPDFIFDRARSNFRMGEKDFVFTCDEQAHHYLLSQSCFRVMEACLRFNMGDIPSSFLFDRDHIVALSERVNQNITPVLRYSCGHWAHHLPSLQIDTNILCSYISDFLEIRVLFWIEVMNLLGLRHQCTRILQSARQWVLKWTNGFIELARNVGEAANFATHFTTSPAAESTPHLYISALATWSQDSSLSRNWKQHFSCIPVFTHTTGNIDLPLMTIQAESEILAVAFSSDGTRIVSGSFDSSVRVWDASTGAEQKVLHGHSGWVYSVAFSSDGMQIVSGSGNYEHSVRVWDALTGAEQKVLNGHTGSVYSVAFSSDGMRIVSASEDKSVRVWDALTGVEQKVLNGHTNFVTSVAFSGNGIWIVSGSSDNSVRLWDASTGAEQKVLNGHTDIVTSVAFSSDGMQIVSGSYDKTVRVWDVSIRPAQKVLNGHTEIVTSVAFSSDGMQVVSGSYDKSVRVWDASTGAEQKVLNGHTRIVTSVAFSNDGTWIVSGSEDNSVQVWDASRSPEQKVLNGHTSFVRSVAFSSDGMQIVSGSIDKSVRVWDASTGAEQKVLNGHTDEVTSVAFSNDGMQIVSGSCDKSVRVWVVSTGTEHKKLNGHTGIVTSVAFSSDGMQIVSGSIDKSVRMWDALTGAEQKVLNSHTSPVYSVAFSSDGMRIVSGSSDKYVRVWDASTGAEQEMLNGHTDWVYSVAFSSDGMRIVSCSYDKSVRVWDASTGAELQVLNGHTIVCSAAFSSDGTQIVSGSDDSSVRVWDALTGVEQKVLHGHMNSVSSVAFSNDGMRIVSGSNDQSVRVWDVSTLDNYHFVWDLTEENWIISSQGKDHLMWVPPAAGLPRPYNILIISRFGFAAVDFSQAKLGSDWVNCYTPV